MTTSDPGHDSGGATDSVDVTVEACIRMALCMMVMTKVPTPRRLQVAGSLAAITIRRALVGAGREHAESLAEDLARAVGAGLSAALTAPVSDEERAGVVASEGVSGGAREAIWACANTAGRILLVPYPTPALTILIGGEMAEVERLIRETSHGDLEGHRVVPCSELCRTAEDMRRVVQEYAADLYDTMGYRRWRAIQEEDKARTKAGRTLQ